MKVVILAGGYGTRLSEQTSVVPKPLVEIGGRPILWHIMKLYSHYGLNEFVICCGYKGTVIKDYFMSYLSHQGDFTLDLQRNRIEMHRNGSEPWQVTLVDTGEKTMTGGASNEVREHLGNSTFCMTYGDGVSDVDIRALIKFHHQHGALATVTAVQLPGRFGAINLSSDRPPRGRLSREERERRSGHQRRFLRCRTSGPRSHRRRQYELGKRASRPSDRAGPTGCLQAPWLLAEHGHLARQGHSPGSLGYRRSTLVRLE